VSRRALIAFSVTAGSILMVTTAINVVVNPLGYYPTKWFEPLAWSSRSEKVKLMRAAPSPGVLILGSSRTMKLDPDEIRRLSSGTPFNAAVDSARAEDLYALTRFALEELGWQPKEIIIGVDLEAFHDHIQPDNRLIANADLRRFLPLEIQWEAAITAAEGLISETQLRSSIRSLSRSMRGGRKTKATFAADGHLRYDEWEEQIQAGSFTPDIEASLAEYERRFDGFRGLDPRRMQLFEELLRLAESRNIRVRAFITPLHPQLIERLRKTRDFDRLHGLVVAYLEELRAAHPMLIAADFTDVTEFSGDPGLFFDGAHLRDENTILLVQKLYADGEHAVQ
jgi:hypothetical protein